MQPCQEEEEEVGEEESRVTSHDMFLGRPEHSLGAPIPLPCDDGRYLQLGGRYTLLLLLLLLLSLLLPVVLTAQNCRRYLFMPMSERSQDTRRPPMMLTRIP